MNITEWLKTFSIDIHDLIGLMFHLALNLITLTIIIRFLYYPVTRRKDFFFSFFLTGIIIFFFCYLLSNVQLQFGFVIGLFAIFRIIRFRTDSISVKEMTYLAIIIGISVINALLKAIPELLFTNIVIIVIIYCLEYFWLRNKENSKIILYEKIDLIKPENYNLLLDDLKNRTGINIHRLEIGKIDFLHDTAQIRIYFIEQGLSMHYTDPEDR